MYYISLSAVFIHLTYFKAVKIIILKIKKTEDTLFNIRKHVLNALLLKYKSPMALSTHSVAFFVRK